MSNFDQTDLSELELSVVLAEKTIEKINFEKNNLSSLNEDNKIYIRKLESFLVFASEVNFSIYSLNIFLSSIRSLQ